MDGLIVTSEDPDDIVNTTAFCYELAFSRNLGWLMEWEQQALRGKRVAIAGSGGVGGFHLLTLARFGIGAFSIADLDKFELANFNRQVGATLASIGRPKVEVMAESALQINPELRIACFGDGVTEENLDEFLSGADLCIDALDFFVLGVRRKLSQRCAEIGIPLINAAPLGMGTGLLIFMPGGPSFEDWFRLDRLSEEQQYVSYLLGMAPSALHRGYLVDPSRVDLRGHRGPSTVAGCELCAGVAAVEAIKILLGRGRVRAVPYYHQFDAYRGRLIVKKLKGGNHNPLQRLKIALTRRLAARLSDVAVEPMVQQGTQTDIEKILDLARWAPSGDNAQPWKFQIVGEDRVVICLTDQTHDDLFDFRDGEPTLLGGGALLESMRIAASAWGRGLEWHYRGRQSHTHQIDVRIPRVSGIGTDPLISFLPLRSVDRRPYRLRSLSYAQKVALAEALGPEFEIKWHEPLLHRWYMARLGAKATSIRLATPEAFRVHQRVLDWEHRYSTTGIPATAAGLSRTSLRLVRWAMQSWPRMQYLNRFGGVLAGAIQMDYVPGIFSSAFFAVRAIQRTCPDLEPVDRLIGAGQAIQRFWLTATRLGLAVQPNFAILIFAHYGREGISFTKDKKTLCKAQKLSADATAIFGENERYPIFFGRIGLPRTSQSRPRSIRHSLSHLLNVPFSRAP